MLSSFERGIITLIKNALNGENEPLPEDFDYSKLYEFAIKQQILPLLYYGGMNDPQFVANDEGSKAYTTAMYLSAVDQNQVAELEGLCRTFEENGVDHMRLKGSIIKRLYPSSEMRIMGDADILIRENQMDAIEKIMAEQGYSHCLTSDHEWIWHKDELDVELHKRMIPSYTKDLYAYFGEGLNLAKPKVEGGHEYVLGSEDELIYLVAHFTKHYRYAGIGIKHLVDIHVFLETHRDIDFDYVDAALGGLGILRFYQHVKKTLDVWFSGADGDEISEFITGKVFSSGAYGTPQARSRYEAAVLTKGMGARKARIRKIRTVLFPSYKSMCDGYPWLRRCPVLLPFAWIYRFAIALLFRRDRIRRERENISVIKKSEIDSYKAELNLVGLDFNFEV
jgi:hypothetical protein